MNLNLRTKKSKNKEEEEEEEGEGEKAVRRKRRRETQAQITSRVSGRAVKVNRRYADGDERDEGLEKVGKEDEDEGVGQAEGASSEEDEE